APLSPPGGLPADAPTSPARPPAPPPPPTPAKGPAPPEGPPPASPPPGLWTREASWSAPRGRGAFDPTSHTHSPRDPPHPTAAKGHAPTESPAPSSRTPPGLWTREASWSAPREIGRAHV